MYPRWNLSRGPAPTHYNDQRPPYSSYNDYHDDGYYPGSSRSYEPEYHRRPYNDYYDHGYYPDRPYSYHGSARPDLPVPGKVLNIEYRRVSPPGGNYHYGGPSASVIPPPGPSYHYGGPPSASYIPPPGPPGPATYTNYPNGPMGPSMASPHGPTYTNYINGPMVPGMGAPNGPPTYTMPPNAPTYYPGTTVPYNLPPPSATLSPPGKSYYDTYSRFSKVDFHTVKSPYSMLQTQTPDHGTPAPQTPPYQQTGYAPEQPRPQDVLYHQQAFSGPQQSPPSPVPRAAPVQQGFGGPSSNPVPTPVYAATFNPPPAPRAAPAAAPQASGPGGESAEALARKAFRRYDTDGNGFLDIYEFMAAMKQLGTGTTFKEAQEAFDEIDTDRGGSIEEDEFVAWYIRNFATIQSNTDPRKLAQAMFRKYDKDGNGSLDIDEFVGAMRELGLGYSPEDAQYVFDTFDRDGGGTIDEKEFVDNYYEQWLQGQ